METGFIQKSKSSVFKTNVYASRLKSSAGGMKSLILFISLVFSQSSLLTASGTCIHVVSFQISRRENLTSLVWGWELPSCSWIYNAALSKDWVRGGRDGEDTQEESVVGGQRYGLL